GRREEAGVAERVIGEGVVTGVVVATDVAAAVVPGLEDLPHPASSATPATAAPRMTPVLAGICRPPSPHHTGGAESPHLSVDDCQPWAIGGQTTPHGTAHPRAGGSALSPPRRPGTPPAHALAARWP